ncbi:unnamed protein product [Psylliodes chrysocephalus]|uniref:Uncharacterized protein n=1 Tax=Psylliodes chrysocephalus TaxID=3402493 RepID=A0A9P0CZJ8_9CUCU|nr:unnamed protein product [Psylliodes chrysocephala]
MLLLHSEYLNHTYCNRWIGRGGTQSWPPRSSDLNRLYHFFWGHLKSLVYAVPIQTKEELRNRIIVCCQAIRNTPGIFENVSQSIQRRVDACIRGGGGHFQQINNLSTLFYLDSLVISL